MKFGHNSETDMIKEELCKIDFEAIEKVKNYVYNLDPDLIIDLVNQAMGYKMLDNSRRQRLIGDKPIYNYTIVQREDFCGWDISWVDKDNKECGLLIESFNIHTFDVPNSYKLKQYYIDILSECEACSAALRARYEIMKIGQKEDKCKKLDQDLEEKLKLYKPVDSTLSM